MSFLSFQTDFLDFSLAYDLILINEIKIQCLFIKKVKITT